ncbi:MAG: formylmethanofuran dehydrogenase subunit B [Thioploca sp.]|nr:formylmethanofuran dehydrogenase subunit B [Thioploca sp.]
MQSNLTITCPFCSLLCEDLNGSEINGRLYVQTQGCEKASTCFAKPPLSPLARVSNRTVSQDEAIGEAAQLLRGAHLPVYASLDTDVDGVRAVISLAKRTGGVIDQITTPCASVLALQSSGCITTTLTEIRNRADLIILIGAQVETHFPRLINRCLQRTETLFNQPSAQPEIIVIGEASHIPHATTIPLAEHLLPEFIAMLKALLVDVPLQAQQVGEVSISELAALVKRMQQINYGVIIWHTESLNTGHIDLVVQALCELVKAFNKITRFAALPLEDGVTARQVCVWQTGFPLRINFSRHFPEYNPWQFSSQRLLSTKEADTLVWISSFAHTQLPDYDIPTIVLANQLPEGSRPPDIFIPVGTPGLDHSGYLFRVDQAVVLPLQQCREAGLSSAAAVLKKIEARL